MMKLSWTVAASALIITLCGGVTLTTPPIFSQVTEKHNSRGGEGKELSIASSLKLKVPAVLAQKPPSPSSELGQELMKQVTECIVSKLPNPQKPSIEVIQGVSMECVIKVVMLTPDGKARPDANDRMIALIRTSGMTIPKSSSQGQASVQMQQIPNSPLFSVPVTVGGQQRNFLLDTGASNSILDSQVAQQLNLTGTPIPSDILAYFVVGDDCSQVKASLHKLPPLAVQSATVEGLDGMGLPKISIPDNASGVLGLDFLKGFDVIVNPKTLQLQLLPPSNAVAGAVPLVGKLGVMTAQAKINGKGPFTLMLDTGAGFMVISERLAGQLSIDVVNAKSVQVRGFCGLESGKQIKLGKVSLQEHEASQLDAIILDNKIFDLLGIDGIIGQNFLTRYRQHWRFGQPNELGFPEEGSLVLTPVGN